ncbi:MAG TPA: phosphoribosylglycinamide formyltransferase [Chloroflexota bacterium]|nr:phosphoribosylglycinamide formyltransferase [Chloroflexota bacterium]
MRLRLGVLASGRGTTLQAILNAAAGEGFPAEVAIVLSNRPSAPALRRARAAGVPAFALPQQRFPSLLERDLALVQRLREHQVDLVVLAGYDRVLAPAFPNAFPGRVINLHPSLLPAFGGEHATAPRPQQAALEYGCKLAGCTVQFVVDDGGIDTGPIIAQSAVPIFDDDTLDTLVARLLHEEHRLLLDAIRAIAAGEVRLEGRCVRTGRLRPPDEPPLPA